MYSSEIWGIEYRQVVETIHHYACKRYMSVRLNSTNDAVLGECGHFPLNNQYNKSCITYWLKILRMAYDRYVKKCYVMLKCFADVGISNWASCIKNILYSNGFGYAWESQSVENEKQFKSLFVQRLKDKHLQSWFEKINPRSKLTTNRGFKTTYEHEYYLNFITNRKCRRTIAQSLCTRLRDWAWTI